MTTKQTTNTALVDTFLLCINYPYQEIEKIKTIRSREDTILNHFEGFRTVQILTIR